MRHPLADDRTRARGIDLILAQIDSLPTLPSIATRLLRMSSAEDADFRQIVAMIESDPALTAKILGLCRKADKRRAEDITTVDRAVVYLGFESVRSAALSVSAYELLSTGMGAAAATPRAESAFDRNQFWRHSIAVACAAEGLAEEAAAAPDLPKPAGAFVCGLLHGIGSLALDHALPRAFAGALRLAGGTDESLAAVERRLLGVDHHAAGRRLAERWDLPPMLRDVIWLAGLPFDALPDVPHKRAVGLINTAIAIARSMHLGWSGDPAAIDSPERLCEACAIDPAAVAAVRRGLHAEVSARAEMLGMKSSGGEDLLLESIGQANRELERLRRVTAREATHGERAERTLARMAQFRAVWAATIAEAAESIAAWAHDQFDARRFALALRESDAGRWEVLPFEASDASAPGAPMRAMPAESIATPPTTTQAAPAAGPIADALGLRPGRWRACELPALRGALVLFETESPGAPAQIDLDVALAAWAGAVVSARRAEECRRLRDEASRAGMDASDLKGRVSETEALSRKAAFATLAIAESVRPISLLRARTEVLQQTLTQQRDLRNVDAIATATERLDSLLSAMRLTLDPPKPAPQPTDVAPLLGRAIREAMKRVGSNPKRVSQPRIRLLVDESARAAVFDAERVAAATTELVANSLEVPDVTLIEVSAQSEPESDRLLIGVKDDGPGMPPETLARAFQPFAIQKKHTQRKGLGLVMAERLVSVMGGSVSVANNASGKGLTATISARIGGSEPPGAEAPEGTFSGI